MENPPAPSFKLKPLPRPCKFGGKVRPGNVCFLWWGYDPPGKPEILIFVTETDDVFVTYGDGDEMAPLFAVSHQF